MSFGEAQVCFGSVFARCGCYRLTPDPSAAEVTRNAAFLIIRGLGEAQPAPEGSPFPPLVALVSFLSRSPV